jgi:glycosyltransferase involved in cell wall biosynthesis
LFAGSFARGAFHIPPLLERLRLQRNDFSVEIFCNLNPSRDPEKDAAYIAWLRMLPNIAHIGMVGQRELAQRMRGAAVMIAPNPWPETSCIALIEGLASGMLAVTTERAALPETASGFALQILMEAPDDPVRFDQPVDYDEFAAAVLEVMRLREEDPGKTEAQLRHQVDYFLTHYQWVQRVAPWVEYVSSLSK